MAPTVAFSDELFERAQKLAIPLVDTLETVVAKAFDALEAAQAGHSDAGTAQFTAESGAAVKAYNPAMPPNLAFTKPLSISFRGDRFAHGQLYWNALMLVTIRAAAESGLEKDALLRLMVVPSLIGQKDEQGYKYLKEIGISVQGQDANGAWRQAYHIAKELGFPLEVVWRWQNTEKAGVPGQKGSFSVG